jgi:ParB/RepB/Spo0J family partition protein
MNAPETPAPPANATAVALLPVATIVASLSNPRKHFDDTYIAELADSIKSHGLIQPITVRPLSLDALFAFNRGRHENDERPTYEIVVGECRWRAAKLAGLHEIPAFWRELDDKQVLEIQVIENLQRRDVHEIEEAEGYQALIARHGYTADEIAAKIGKSRSYVYGRLKFTALCRDVRESFFAGKLDGSTALLIARIPGEALQKKAAKEVINGYNGEPLSHRAAKQHIHSRYTLSLKQATFRPDDATLLPAAGACSACPKLSGNFRDLFNDIEAADVCTDPDCFEAKRQARRDQLIANAEKRKIPVYLGDQAREIRHGDIEYVSLDAEVDDDAEGRTYRQILGDKAPVAALIERQWGQKELDECADLTALEKALKKAGWKPAEPEAPPPRAGETAEEAKAREASHAANQARAAHRQELRDQANAENERRKQALTASLPKLHALPLDTDKTTEDLLYLLAEAWFRNVTGFNELADLEDNIRTHLDADYALPEEFDDADEVPRAIALLRRSPLSRVVALMLNDFAHGTECHITEWSLDDDRNNQAAPHIIAGLTRLLDVPFTSLTHPASTPSNAAHASDVGATAAPTKTKPAKKPAAKKAKAKADPAPSSTANEPASPAKTEGTPTPMPAWPFPTGARP